MARADGFLGKLSTIPARDPQFTNYFTYLPDRVSYNDWLRAECVPGGLLDGVALGDWAGDPLLEFDPSDPVYNGPFGDAPYPGNINPTTYYQGDLTHLNNTGAAAVAAIDATAILSIMPQIITGVTSHNDLTDLEDDDHPQYAKKAGDTFTGTINGTSIVLSGQATADAFASIGASAGYGFFDRTGGVGQAWTVYSTGGIMRAYSGAAGGDVFTLTSTGDGAFDGQVSFGTGGVLSTSSGYAILDNTTGVVLRVFGSNGLALNGSASSLGLDLSNTVHVPNLQADGAGRFIGGDVVIDNYPANTFPAIWLDRASPDGTNYSLTGVVGTGTFLNAAAFESVYVRIANSTVATFSSDGVTFAVALKPPSLANAAAPNNSIYYSTDASKLVYKDPSGVVNNLY
jgi:hypothetical protein